MTNTLAPQDALVAFHDFVDDLGEVFAATAGEHFTSPPSQTPPQDDALDLYLKLSEAADIEFLKFIETEDWGITFKGDVGTCLYDLFCLPSEEARWQATEDLFALLEVY